MLVRSQECSRVGLVNRRPHLGHRHSDFRDFGTLGYPDSADWSLAKYQSQPRICIATANPCTHGRLMKIAAIPVATVMGTMTVFCAGHCAAPSPWPSPALVMMVTTESTVYAMRYFRPSSA